MNDYKELIKELRKEFDNCDDLISQKIALNLTMASDRKYAILAEDCCSEMPGIMQTISCAINAIEQLVKERDAAVKCLPQRCTLCKHYTAEDGACYDERKCADWACHPNWEWRGVRDE